MYNANSGESYPFFSLFTAVDMMNSHCNIQVRREMTIGDMFARLEPVPSFTPARGKAKADT